MGDMPVPAGAVKRAANLLARGLVCFAAYASPTLASGS